MHKKAPSPPPLEISNRFEELSLPTEEPAVDEADGVDSEGSQPTGRDEPASARKSVLVVGDSNVKRIDRWLIPDEVDRSSVGVVSLRGARIKDVSERIVGMVQKEADECLVVLQVGVNDVERRCASNVLEDLVQLGAQTKHLKTKAEVRVCTIPERVDRGRIAYDRARWVNERLVSECSKVGVKVIDWRAAVSYSDVRWTKDGVHFNRTAGRIVGEKISEFVRDFLG